MSNDKAKFDPSLDDGALFRALVQTCTKICTDTSAEAVVLVLFDEQHNALSVCVQGKDTIPRVKLEQVFHAVIGGFERSAGQPPPQSTTTIQ